MSSEKVVETVYGKYYKFDVVKKSDIFGTKFFVRKDGKPHRGPFSSLRDAVAAAENEG